MHAGSQQRALGVPTSLFVFQAHTPTAEMSFHGSHSSSVSANPTIFFSILDHYLRRPDGQARAVGVLLGVRSEDGSELEIRNSFAVPHKEPEVDLAMFIFWEGACSMRSAWTGTDRQGVF